MIDINGPAGFVLIIAIIFLSAWSGFWVYKDAPLRGLPGFKYGLLVFLAVFPIGLLAWWAFRPPRVQKGQG